MAGLFLIIIIKKKSEYLLSDPCEEHDWSEGSPQQATTGSATCRASKGEKESNVKDISKQELSFLQILHVPYLFRKICSSSFLYHLSPV